MSDLVQVASQIRFGLDQLGAKNAHHEFEHLCRHLTRARICSNVIPATGPVAAGGDQGRDFETFRTYLEKNLPHASGFLGLAAEKPVAFACSLEREKSIRSKIRDDAHAIASSGHTVSDVHYFCVADVPTAARHALQDWARKKHSLHLEVYDGQAIAELLSEQDVFWIAVRFLEIPQEIYPRPPEGKSAKWYTNMLAQWRNPGASPSNHRDFCDLKAAVRHATFTEAVKQDLPFWIGLLQSLKKGTNFAPLKRRCTYEIAVARLRGQGTLAESEGDIREYFQDIEHLTDTSEIRDTCVLLQYCVGALPVGATLLSVEEIKGWKAALVEKVETELKASGSPGRICSLLEDRAYLYICPEPGTRFKPEMEGAARCWRQLLEIADQAPLYPIEHLADSFTRLIELGLEWEGLGPMIERVEALLSARHGNFVIAEKCRDRAFAYASRGEILKAIDELHNSKLKWFAAETLKGSMLACLCLSGLYGELGLRFAAKHYALVAAHVALHSPEEAMREYVPKGLIVAAEADYVLGGWYGFLALASVGLRAFALLSREDDSSEPNEINRSLFHATTLRAITSLLAPDLLGVVDAKLVSWGMDDCLQVLQPVADDAWAKIGNTGIKTRLEKEGVGSPWNDLGETRLVSFNALGVNWAFTWENSYQVAPEAEEFIAAFQIILAALGGVDLCLLRTEVKTRIEFSPEWKTICDPIASNDRVLLRLTLPSSVAAAPDEGSGSSREEILLAAATSLLLHVSVYNNDEFLNVISGVFKEGIFAKAFFGGRYAGVYSEFVGAEQFADCVKQEQPAHPDIASPAAHPKLAWYGGPGPHYSAEENREAIKRRYERVPRPIQDTIKKLLQDPNFRTVAMKLRREGWLDWHILLAVANVAINCRAETLANLLPKKPTLAERGQMLQSLTAESEGKFSVPVALSEFSEDRLRMLLECSMLTTLTQLGHQIHMETPDLKAVSDFLGERYGYWSEDVEHSSLGFDA